MCGQTHQHFLQCANTHVEKELILGGGVTKDSQQGGEKKGARQYTSRTSSTPSMAKSSAIPHEMSERGAAMVAEWARSMKTGMVLTGDWISL
jgi:hypothetical protein